MSASVTVGSRSSPRSLSVDGLARPRERDALRRRARPRQVVRRDVRIALIRNQRTGHRDVLPRQPVAARQPEADLGVVADDAVGDRSVWFGSFRSPPPRPPSFLAERESGHHLPAVARKALARGELDPLILGVELRLVVADLVAGGWSSDGLNTTVVIGFAVGDRLRAIRHVDGRPRCTRSAAARCCACRAGRLIRAVVVRRADAHRRGRPAARCSPLNSSEYGQFDAVGRVERVHACR